MAPRPRRREQAVLSRIRRAGKGKMFLNAVRISATECELQTDKGAPFGDLIGSKHGAAVANIASPQPQGATAGAWGRRVTPGGFPRPEKPSRKEQQHGMRIPCV